MNPQDKAAKDSDAAKDSSGRPWFRGAMTSAAGVLVGSLAFALFCYALGLNFSDEGWAEGQHTDRLMLAISLVGFAVAILVFWLGFFQVTHSRS